MQVKKEKVPKGPGCVETLSSGLDLNARDARGINADINVSALSWATDIPLCSSDQWEICVGLLQTDFSPTIDEKIIKAQP